MARRIIKTGDRHGRLVVVAEAPRSERHRFWKCQCDCGNTTVVRQDHLGKRILACGCLQRERASEANSSHGLSQTPEYTTWERIKNRCLNPNAADRADYADRGITVCQRWQDSFLD